MEEIKLLKRFLSSQNGRNLIARNPDTLIQITKGKKDAFFKALGDFNKKNNTHFYFKTTFIKGKQSWRLWHVAYITANKGPMGDKIWETEKGYINDSSTPEPKEPLQEIKIEEKRNNRGLQGFFTF